MKRRIRKVVNFFAFNLLFFALYLNFIHKDKPNVVLTPVPVQAAAINATMNGTVLVSNPEKYTDPKTTSNNNSVQPAKADSKAEKNDALKLSIN
jgi:hypothetical protein